MYGAHRYLNVLTPSFPTRRAAELSRDQVAHHAGAQDEAVIGAAAHPAGADLGEDMAAVDRYLVLGAGHDLEQMVRRVPEDIVALLAQIGDRKSTRLNSSP